MTAVNWATGLPWPQFLALFFTAWILAGTGLVRLGNWVAGRRWPRPEPAPEPDGLDHLVSVVNCRACRDQPDGDCSCEIDCYHVRCGQAAAVLHQERP